MAPAVRRRRYSSADSSNADLNGGTVAPSELVPSAKRSTTAPLSIALRLLATPRDAASLLLRSTKIVPAARASHPNNGQPATSRFATKIHGATELSTSTSR